MSFGRGNAGKGELHAPCEGSTNSALDGPDAGSSAGVRRPLLARRFSCTFSRSAKGDLGLCESSSKYLKTKGKYQSHRRRGGSCVRGTYTDSVDRPIVPFEVISIEDSLLVLREGNLDPDKRAIGEEYLPQVADRSAKFGRPDSHDAGYAHLERTAWEGRRSRVASLGNSRSDDGWRTVQLEFRHGRDRCRDRLLDGRWSGTSGSDPARCCTRFLCFPCSCASRSGSSG